MFAHAGTYTLDDEKVVHRRCVLEPDVDRNRSGAVPQNWRRRAYAKQPARPRTSTLVDRSSTGSCTESSARACHIRALKHWHRQVLGGLAVLQPFKRRPAPIAMTPLAPLWAIRRDALTRRRGTRAAWSIYLPTPESFLGVDRLADRGLPAVQPIREKPSENASRSNANCPNDSRISSRSSQ